MAKKHKGSAPDDGRGRSDHKGITPAESVDGSAHQDTPGGESSGGDWWKGEGPNPGSGHVSTPKKSR